ncbi:hypothetical protein [Nitrosomonas aestuarii]|uniref:hypothetical protein n=1 Tax=Nitrosomonas aestuarii TaxID=52441 RepID=UPI00147E695E|nr:hypothetical protein [Nitrosomonas aestuarii]
MKRGINRWRAGPVCFARAPAPVSVHSKDTGRQDCWSVTANKDWFRRRDGWA